MIHLSSKKSVIWQRNCHLDLNDSFDCIRAVTPTLDIMSKCRFQSPLLQGVLISVMLV